MYAKLKQFISTYWLILFFLLIALFIAVFGVSFEDLYSTLLKLQLWQVALLIIAFFVASAVHISSRKYLLHSLGAECGLKNLSYIHFATLAAHYSTPVKIGIPVAIYLLNKVENVDYSKTTAMLLLEIAISTALCGLVAIIGIPAILGISLKSAIVFFVLAGLSVLAVLFIFITLYKKSEKRGRFLNYIFNTIDAVRGLRTENLAIYLALSLLLRLVDGIYLLLLCMFLAQNLTVWQAVVTTSTAFFVGTISMVPMGLGTRDISLLLLLQHYDISNDSAVVIVTLQRMLTTGLSFIVGIYCGSVLGVRNVKSAKNVQNENLPEV